jgi:hypothetical protein
LTLITRCQAFYAAERPDTGIVDQHRQPTHGRVRLRQRALPARFEDHVLNRRPGDLGVQLRIDAVGQCTDRSSVEIGEKNFCTLARQHSRRRGTQAAGGAGDQGLLAGHPPCRNIGHWMTPSVMRTGSRHPH